ncbi:hypothetical protein SAMN05428953_12627 [Mesorhizobium muleiense]|uniref:Transcriptional regulatory protein, C terminal n=1 Tax=Mesorhizobium muleiense TaxID=1004279 RepID=A0A1G9H0G3_9HYPH|nr:hypothetical protein [Mesorhizobium muleiense]SDL06352.1 hypothetical protein SAMN05428953_12627 [Mesorhizobium muleiense]
MMKQHINVNALKTRHTAASFVTSMVDDDLTKLERAAPSMQSDKKGLVLAPIDCPCCKQRVTVPTLDIVIDRYKVTPLEARILGAVWKGKGMPVMTERIFDAMYSDDPDGGPSPTRMYAAFKVALCHLRARLAGSGIAVENVGYRQGYRLILGVY